MITSAYFFDGRTKSSKAGFTNFAYCTIKMALASTEFRSLPLSTVSRLILRANLCQQKSSYSSSCGHVDHGKPEFPPR
ncbi:hypothetical protein CsSME_00053175 [Camellia sinensis var. sinensis]